MAAVGLQAVQFVAVTEHVLQLPSQPVHCAPSTLMRKPAEQEHTPPLSVAVEALHAVHDPASVHVLQDTLHAEHCVLSALKKVPTGHEQLPPLTVAPVTLQRVHAAGPAAEQVLQLESQMPEQSLPK